MKSGFRDLGVWIENDGLKKLKRVTRLENDSKKKRKIKNLKNPHSTKIVIMERKFQSTLMTGSVESSRT